MTEKREREKKRERESKEKREKTEDTRESAWRENYQKTEERETEKRERERRKEREKGEKREKKGTTFFNDISLCSVFERTNPNLPNNNNMFNKHQKTTTQIHFLKY